MSLLQRRLLLMMTYGSSVIMIVPVLIHLMINLAQRSMYWLSWNSLDTSSHVEIGGEGILKRWQSLMERLLLLQLGLLLEVVIVVNWHGIILKGLLREHSLSRSRGQRLLLLAKHASVFWMVCLIEVIEILVGLLRRHWFRRQHHLIIWRLSRLYLLHV